MVDPQAGHALFAPASYQGMRSSEDSRIFDAHPGECGDGKKSAVIEIGVGARVVHQLVVLSIMYCSDVVTFGPRPWSKWEAVFEVAQFAVDQAQLRIIAENGNHDPASTPVDVEPEGVWGLLAEPQDVPPGWILDRMLNAEMVRHNVDDHPKPRQPRAGHKSF